MHQRHLRFGLALILGSSSIFAQEQPNNGDQQLPPITVRPLDPITVRPPQDPFSYVPGNLGEINFDSEAGALRSNRSIFDDPRNITAIDSAEIGRKNAKDMKEALQNEVGVLIQSTGRGQAAPFVRGLTGQQVLIMVDGIRMNNSIYRSGPNQYFNTIDPGMVERIEVVRGPQTALWGSDAIGGVINVVTRSANIGYTTDYLTGEYVQRFTTQDSGSYSRINVDGSMAGRGFFGGGSYLNVHDLDIGGPGRQPFTNYSQYAGDIRFDSLVGNDAKLTVSLQHLEQEDVPRTDRFPGRKTLFESQQRDLGYVRFQHDPVEDRFIDYWQVTGSYNRQRQGIFDQRASAVGVSFDRNETDVETTGVTMVAESDANDFGIFTYGADWYHDDISSVNNRFADPSGALLSSRVPPYPDGSYYEQVGAFLQWDVQLTRRLSAVSAIRYSLVDLNTVPIIDVAGTPTPVTLDTSFNDWSPSIGLVYELDPYWHLVGSFAKGWRAPNIDDLAANNDNVQQGSQDTPSINLIPEESYNYEVGLKWNERRFRGQAFVFWNDFENYIQRTPAGFGGGNTLFSRTNRDSYINGTEIAGEYLMTPEWSLYGNFWYILGEDLETDQPLSRIPPTQGILGLRWQDRYQNDYFESFIWAVRHQDKLNFQDISDSRIPAGGTPGYATWNMRYGRKIGCNHRVSLTFENILDKLYKVHGSGVFGPGIGATVGYEGVY